MMVMSYLNYRVRPLREGGKRFVVGDRRAEQVQNVSNPDFSSLRTFLGTLTYKIERTWGFRSDNPNSSPTLPISALLLNLTE